MKITTGLLFVLGADGYEIDTFSEAYPDGVEFTLTECLRVFMPTGNAFDGSSQFDLQRTVELFLSPQYSIPFHLFAEQSARDAQRREQTLWEERDKAGSRRARQFWIITNSNLSKDAEASQREAAKQEYAIVEQRILRLIASNRESASRQEIELFYTTVVEQGFDVGVLDVAQSVEQLRRDNLRRIEMRQDQAENDE
jgi:hypothetical protein